MYRVGVDIGGTFTDFALFDARGAKMSVHKRLTTPHDPSEAVTEGIDALLKRDEVAIADVSDVVHGTTLVTNAVIERRGAVTGMLATAGFSDILDMGFERRYDLFDLRVKYPPPLVPRRLRLEVAERVRFDGSVETAARRSRRAGRRADASRSWASPPSPSASCMPTPTRRTRRAPPRSCARPRRTCSCPPRPTCSRTCASSSAGRRPPSTPSPSRCSTATSSDWRRAWPSQGFRGRLYIMSSSGGTLTADTARRFPVRALESGPAAGALMSAYHGRSLDLPNLLSFDMGGTTAKGALVRGGTPDQALRHGSGARARVPPGQRPARIRIPVIDMIEIGAGGGSIADIDDRGLLRVGPRSAGADPGPACYGRGGTRPTLTDANLVLGYLDAGFFLGGTMALDRPAAETRHPRRRRQAARARDAARGLGHPRHRQRGRGARLPHPRQRARLRLPLGQHGGVRRLGTAACAQHRRASSRSRAWCSRSAPASCRRSGLLISPLAFEMARSRRIHVADIDAADFAATLRGAGDARRRRTC